MKLIRVEEDMLSRKNVHTFMSTSEMQEQLSLKLYKINETYEAYRLDHTHDYFQIWYVNKGEFMHSIDRHKYRMVRGNLFVIPPFAVHRVDLIPGKEFEIYGCEFLPQFINDRFDQLPFNKDVFDFAYLEHFLVDDDEITPKIALAGQIDIDVKQLLEEMFNEYQTRRAYFELALKGSLLKLLSIIMREYALGANQELNNKLDKYRHAITSVLDELKKRYHEDITLEEICKKALLSKTYFYILFKHFVGKTFNEYIIELRVQKAMSLLQSNLSVTDVCFSVGFNSVSYFSRVFKKITGVSPSNYKKNALM
ncbi:AraC family transcriptional regulator [Paenibacillus sp. GXUN7292]|uniref:AraC family transcriptional regulator n=1 Tax=Paenibacillus sp. GXUN7292 TaxID=3422499 RepID=UPI003D7D6DE8